MSWNSILRSALVAIVTLLLATTTVAGLNHVAESDGATAPQVEADDDGVVPEVEPGDPGPPEGAGPPEGVREKVKANTDKAAARAAAAGEHAEGIMAWTACIADNAASPNGEPRDDSFDPKVGCENLRPAPPTDPDDPEIEVENED